jgi:dTDP-4-amino-4,6-dideoxygalactose transaminase
MMTIPFNKPFIDLRVIDYIRPVIESGRLSGDGPVCKEVEATIQQLFSARHVMLTTSGTHALEMAMMLLSLKPDDEVIMPSFTFVSTANSVLRCGGKPVFCEINDETLTLDPADFERKITHRTMAVAPVHYAGVAAAMDEIIEIAHSHDVTVIEDAAQGVNAKYKGKYVGTIGDIGAYSFHDTKNYVSGEGGALVTNDEGIARRAEVVREKGTNRANFLRGEVDKYTWVDHGSSFVLSDILAAVLKYQLDSLDSIQQRRKRIHDQYIAGLKDLEKQERLRLPIIPEHCESNYHIFYLLLRNEGERNEMIQKLKDCGIGTTFHYVPLHSSPYARRVLGAENVKLPVTDRVSGTILRLPIYPQLTDDEVEYVVNNLRVLLK